MTAIDTITSKLLDHGEWEAFLERRRSGHIPEKEFAALESFVENREYIPAVNAILGGDFGVPEKKQIRKSGTSKKRTVYIFPEAQNNVFKFLTWLMLRKYDSFFSDGLYSFRIAAGANKAVRKIMLGSGLSRMYTYKTDISDYFNSVPVDRLLTLLSELFSDEPELYGIFRGILSSPFVSRNGKTVTEEKGVMAGTPFAVFFANVYLSGLDRLMEEQGFVYARYSDDIIVLAESEEKISQGAETIRGYIADAGLNVNPAKEIFTSPGETVTFLGLSFTGGVIDISDVSKMKIKAKIRRKARALKRWQIKKNVSCENTVRAFVRSVNRRFFGYGDSDGFNWTGWYFPLINTDKTLREIDEYVQYWIRYIPTGKHTKKNYGLSFGVIKDFGYKSLVHEWYRYLNGE